MLLENMNVYTVYLSVYMYIHVSLYKCVCVCLSVCVCICEIVVVCIVRVCIFTFCLFVGWFLWAKMSNSSFLSSSTFARVNSSSTVLCMQTLQKDARIRLNNEAKCQHDNFITDPW